MSSCQVLQKHSQNQVIPLNDCINDLIDLETSFLCSIVLFRTLKFQSREESLSIYLKKCINQGFMYILKAALEQCLREAHTENNFILNLSYMAKTNRVRASLLLPQMTVDKTLSC